jgi:hypothetical protein
MLLSLRFTADSNPSLSARFSITYKPSNPLRNPLGRRQHKSNDFALCLPHVSRDRRAVDVHRSSDVGMAHQPLLNSDRSTDRIQPNSDHFRLEGA